MYAILKYLIYKVLYPMYYKVLILKKIEKKRVLFVENRGANISDNFTLLDERIRKKEEFSIKIFLRRLEEKTAITRILSDLKLLREVAYSEFVFINDTTELFSCIQMREDTKLIQTWHACGAFKKFGYAIADKEYGNSCKEFKRYPQHRNYTAVTVSSEYVEEAYEKAMNIRRKGIVKSLGISRTDVYFDADFKEKARVKITRYLSENDTRKIILYAPTFRGNAGSAKTPDVMDVALMYEQLKEEYVLLVKHHPFVKERWKSYDSYKSFIFDVTDELDIEELICVADICITDYSSVVFEYSLFERPILFFAYDIDEYVHNRGFFQSYEKFIPGPLVKDTEACVQNIKKADFFDNSVINDFRKKYMNACDGCATDRILEFIEYRS